MVHASITFKAWNREHHHVPACMSLWSLMHEQLLVAAVVHLRMQGGGTKTKSKP